MAIPSTPFSNIWRYYRDHDRKDKALRKEIYNDPIISRRYVHLCPKSKISFGAKKLAWNSHLLNLRHRDQHAPEYLELNPNGVVPTLIDQGNVIIESTVICEYLDDAYPESSLVPDAPEHKALMRQWTKWLDEFLHFHTGVLSGSIAFRFQHLERPKDELEAYLRGIPDPRRRERQRQQIELGLEALQFRESVFAFETFLEKLETQLKKPNGWQATHIHSPMLATLRM